MQYEVREEYINDFEKKLVLDDKFIKNECELIKSIIHNYINYFLINKENIDSNSYNDLMETVFAAKIDNSHCNALQIDNLLTIDYQKFYFLYSLGGVVSLKTNSACNKVFYPREELGLLNYKLLTTELENNLIKINKDKLFLDLNIEILKYYFGVIMKTCYVIEGDLIDLIGTKINKYHTINKVDSIFKYMTSIPFKYSMSIDTQRGMISTNDLFKLNRNIGYLPKVDNELLKENNLFSIGNIEHENILIDKNLYQSQSNESVINYFKSKKLLTIKDINELVKRDIFDLKEYIDLNNEVNFNSNIDIDNIQDLLKKINYKQATYPIGNNFKSFSYFYTPLSCKLITNEIYKINNLHYLFKLCFIENTDKRKFFIKKIKSMPVTKELLSEFFPKDILIKITNLNIFKNDLNNKLLVDFIFKYKPYISSLYKLFKRKKYFKKSYKATPFLSNTNNIDSSINADNFVINNDLPSFGFERFNEKIFYIFEEEFQKDKIEAIIYLMTKMFLNKELKLFISNKLESIINYKIMDKYIRQDIRQLNLIISKNIIKTVNYLKKLDFINENEVASFEQLANVNKSYYIKYLFSNLIVKDFTNKSEDNLFLDKIKIDFKLIFKKEALKYV